MVGLSKLAGQGCDGCSLFEDASCGFRPQLQSCSQREDHISKELWAREVIFSFLEQPSCCFLMVYNMVGCFFVLRLRIKHSWHACQCLLLQVCVCVCLCLSERCLFASLESPVASQHLQAPTPVVGKPKGAARKRKVCRGKISQEFPLSTVSVTSSNLAASYIAAS